jgi:hypothetical protein
MRREPAEALGFDPKRTIESRAHILERDSRCQIRGRGQRDIDGPREVLDQEHVAQLVVVNHVRRALADAEGGFGLLVATQAMDLAIGKAQQVGIGAVALRNSRHCGAMSFCRDVRRTLACWGSQ